MAAVSILALLTLAVGAHAAGPCEPSPLPCLTETTTITISSVVATLTPTATISPDPATETGTSSTVVTSWVTEKVNATVTGSSTVTVPAPAGMILINNARAGRFNANLVAAADGPVITNEAAAAQLPRRNKNAGNKKGRKKKKARRTTTRCTTTVTATSVESVTNTASTVSITAPGETVTTVTTTTSIAVSTTTTTSTFTVQPTFYAACGPSNIATGRWQVRAGGDQNYNEPADSAYDCCVRCLLTPLCRASVYTFSQGGMRCFWSNTFNGGTCNPSQWAGAWQDWNGPQLDSMSNGPCGAWTKS